MYNKLYKLIIEGLSGASRAYLEKGRDYYDHKRELKPLWSFMSGDDRNLYHTLLTHKKREAQKRRAVVPQNGNRIINRADPEFKKKKQQKGRDLG